MLPGSKVHYKPPSSDEVRNEWSNIFTSPYALMTWRLLITGKYFYASTVTTAPHEDKIYFTYFIMIDPSSKLKGIKPNANIIAACNLYFRYYLVHCMVII